MRLSDRPARDFRSTVPVRAETCRGGIGRLDVVVVLGLLAVLAAVNFPALQSARETARRMSCQSRLRQLGLALHAYHDTHQCLPPAALWGSEGLDLPNLVSHRDPTPAHVTRENWLWFLLPQLGETELAHRFAWEVPVVHQRNTEVRTTEVPWMKCPSDTKNTPENHYRLKLADGTVAEFARGNYAINGGSEYIPARFGNLSNPGPTDATYRYSEQTREFQWWGNGIAGLNKCYSFDDFKNGLSTVVGIEELRAGLIPEDPRGVWAFGQIGGSITWGHGITGDDGGPNYGGRGDVGASLEKAAYIGADDILGGPLVNKLLTTEYVEAERMQFCTYCNENAQATARSQHPGGIQLITLDGSIRFVSDRVDGGLWHILHSRETPKERFGDQFESDLLGPLPLTEAAAPKRVDSFSGQRDSPSEFANSIGMQFVRVPAGDFVMGLPNKGNGLPYPPDAVPHKVRLTDDYYLGLHEVTQQQFETVMGVNPSWHAPTGDGRDAITLADTSQCPVENVSWDEATKFCLLLSTLPEEQALGRRYRLPTEAEWEYACRAGQTEPIELNLSWDLAMETGEIASKDPKGVQLVTTPVGSYPANPFGVHDMCGNVYEWVADYRAEYAHTPVDNPQGPGRGYLRAIRGWHWVATGPACKVYVSNDPAKGSRFIGFRVVCE